MEKHTRKTNVKYPNLIIEKDLSFTIKSSINVEIFNNDIVCTEFNCFIDNNMTLLRDEKCVCINTDKNNIYKIVFQNSWLSGEFYNEIEMISEHF